MLSEIRIESLGAISAAVAEFDRGLTVLTGETGTGKTMVVTGLQLLGFAPWPMSWYSHLPRQYARAALDVCRYLEVALGTGSGTGSPAGGGAPPTQSRMRRSTYGPWPTCGRSSSAPCPSRHRSAGAQPHGGPR